uniref:ciliary-associated calcium-binding coiled-coil protein 1 isoform X2 n=1 Tax=Jaculus jaculus TaxID=51337 RepID=UPI001E1AF985|nr:ciliary-associated calcium-binding coiled-coil protein 1 isoform X2 [Jaculus jaculus]
MATGSLGTMSGPTTPSGQTLSGSTPDSERNAELPEHRKILSPDFLSNAQIMDLLAEDVNGVQEKLGIFLDFKNLNTCLKDAILLDYYASGFLWAKEMNFSLLQSSKFMTLLDMLLHNLRNLHMSLEDSIKWLGEVMAEIGPNHAQKKKDWPIFDVKQANAIIDYLKISLFQHYRLYDFMFHSSRTEVVIGTELQKKPSSGGSSSVSASHVLPLPPTLSPPLSVAVFSLSGRGTLRLTSMVIVHANFIQRSSALLTYSPPKRLSLSPHPGD